MQVKKKSDVLHIDVHQHIALAPVTTISHTKSAMVRVAADTPLVKDYLRLDLIIFVLNDFQCF